MGSFVIIWEIGSFSDWIMLSGIPTLRQAHFWNTTFAVCVRLWLNLKTPWVIGIPEDSDWAKGWPSRNRGLIPGRVKNFLRTPVHPDQFPCSTRHLFTVYCERLPRNSGRWRGGVNHAPSSWEKVTNAWCYKFSSQYALVCVFLISAEIILRTFTFINAYYLSLFSFEW
jgi:hypothetical protein